MLHCKSLRAVLLILSWSHAVLGYRLPADRREIEAYHVSDKKGAVASESAVCSRIGVDLIQSGGNAADAVSFAFHPDSQILLTGTFSLAGWKSPLRWSDWFVLKPIIRLFNSKLNKNLRHVPQRDRGGWLHDCQRK